MFGVFHASKHLVRYRRLQSRPALFPSLMNIVCAGLNHATAPVSTRERFAVGDRDLATVLDEVRAIDGLEGAVVLSTCNRVEVYAANVCPDRPAEALTRLFYERAGVEAPLYVHDTPGSVRHLFRVASGLDSMVIGETEILGQVKQAYSAASQWGSTTGHLHKLFQKAFHVAKQVRTRTHITRGSTSVGAAAVDLAGKHFGDLAGRRVMILGAGETSAHTARRLVSRGVRTVIVSNRSFDRAVRLAEEIRGIAIPFDNWQTAFPDVDILICSTSAPHFLVTPEKLLPMMEARNRRPLFVIDLAVPRDVDPEIKNIAGVSLYDIDSLEGIVRETLNGRRGELERCEEMIGEHVQAFVKRLGTHHAFNS
jgi:glutamyl-tRNA reductase